MQDNPFAGLLLASLFDRPQLIRSPRKPRLRAPLFPIPPKVPGKRAKRRARGKAKAAAK